MDSPYQKTESSRRWLFWQKSVSPHQDGNGYGIKHSYAGTVPEKTIAERRAKTKRSKISRRKNR